VQVQVPKRSTNMMEPAVRDHMIQFAILESGGRATLRNRVFLRAKP
jgi:hypothetical protein